MKIAINPATPQEAIVAAKLTFMAYHKFSYDIFGHIGEEAAHKYYRLLWLHGYNRFGYQYSYLAKTDNKPVGLMTCYPAPLIKKLVIPTFRQLIYIGKGKFLLHFITHLNNFYYFASNQETYPDEFYIATLSVLPEYRGMGIGAELLEYARKLTREQSLRRCILHVNAENEKGIRFYERNGFTKAKPVEKQASYFRMVQSV